MRIDVALVDDVPLGVDTPHDLERARAILPSPPERTLTRCRQHERARLIAYQGEPGANSHIACNDVFPELEPLPCATFEDAFAAIRTARPRSA